MVLERRYASGCIYLWVRMNPGLSCAQTLRKFNDISTGSF
jgi:hypothetical protein